MITCVDLSGWLQATIRDFTTTMKGTLALHVEPFAPLDVIAECAYAIACAAAFKDLNISIECPEAKPVVVMGDRHRCAPIWKSVRVGVAGWDDVLHQLCTFDSPFAHVLSGLHKFSKILPSTHASSPTAWDRLCCLRLAPTFLVTT